jgi:multidrug efflux system membrane fusion protein
MTIRFLSFFILTLAFSILLSCGNNHQPEISEQIIPVKTFPVRYQEVSIPIRSSGILASPAEMKLSFKIGGIIEKIYFDEGDKVRKGQVLALLKQSEILAQVNQAKSAYENTQRDFERVKTLYEDSVVTLEQMQDVETGLIMAKSSLEIANFNLEYSKIPAPTDGKILKRLAEENELLEQGVPIFIFGSSSDEWIIRTAVIDRDIVRLQVGDSATVTFDAYPGVIFSAHVSEVAESAAPMTGTYEVELILKQSPEKLVSGFVGKIDIYPSRKEKYFLIPIEALVEAEGKRGVIYIPKIPDHTAERTLVDITQILEDQVAISSDLSHTDQVITEGASYLIDGMKIKIVN